MIYFKASVLAAQFSILATEANLLPNADVLEGLEKL